jgi:hypothetical protein
MGMRKALLELSAEKDLDLGLGFSQLVWQESTGALTDEVTLSSRLVNVTQTGTRFLLEGQERNEEARTEA